LILRGVKQVLGREAGAAARLEALRKIELRGAATEFKLCFQSQAFRLDLTDGKNSIDSLFFDPAKTNRELQIGAQSAHVPPTPSRQHKLRAFLDASVLECFVDESVALTARLYSPRNRGIRISIPASDIDAVNSLSLWPLKPISPDRLTS
jgi:sucrose-6-phosphate hydrolase SacC (GH32 family)